MEHETGNNLNISQQTKIRRLNNGHLAKRDKVGEKRGKKNKK